MMTTIDFEYGLHEGVRIIQSGRTGVVKGYWVSDSGTTKYAVRWYDDNGKQNETYYSKAELALSVPAE